MRTRSVIFAALLGALASATANAETSAEPKGRYSMTPVDGGTMRLDTETGAVTLCTRKADAWACEPVKDGSAAGDTAKLEAENRALKEKLRKLEDLVATLPPEPGVPGADAPAPGGVAKLPSEEDVDKAFDYFEGMFRKLRDRIKKLEQPSPEGKPGGSGSL